MEIERKVPPGNENPQNTGSGNPIILNESLTFPNPEQSMKEENNENLKITENPLIQKDEENMNAFLKGDQQSEMNENKVPRIKNRLFKPFKIIRDSIRSQEKGITSETKQNNKTSSLLENEFSPVSKNRTSKKFTYEGEHNKENLNQSNSDCFLKNTKPNKELTTEELREKYKNLVYREFNNDEEAGCTICLENEDFQDDEIVICDLCNSSFHQSCYGSELLNLEETGTEWFCHRCSYLIENDFAFDGVLCDFCPELKGAIKRIKQNSSKHWAHVVCVNWINEIWKTEVKIEEYRAKNSFGRKSLRCIFCEIPYGDCIQCDYSDCQAAFHITCAQKRGVICSWKQMLSLKRESDDQYFSPTYCTTHLKEFNQEMYERSNHLKDKLKQRASDLSYLVKNPFNWRPSRRDSSQRKHAPINTKRDFETLNKENTSSRPQSPQSIEEIEDNLIQKRIKGCSGSEKNENEKRGEPILRERLFGESGDDSNTTPVERKPIVKAKKSIVPTPETKENSLNSKTQHKEAHNGIREFRFRPDVAEILEFYVWADLKQIKKTIEDYMQKNLSYNHGTQEYKLIEGSNLQMILQVPVLKSGQFFKKFIDARCIISNSKQTPSHEHQSEISSNKETPCIREPRPEMIKTTTSTPLKDPPNIVRKNSDASNLSKEGRASPTATTLNRKGSQTKNNEVQSPTQFLPKLEKQKSENLKTNRKLSSDDGKAPKISRKTSESNKLEGKISTDSGQFMENFFSKKDEKLKDNGIKDTASALAGIFSSNKTESSSKPRLGFLGKQDNLIFRKPMKWFSKANVKGLEQYDTKGLMELLWPKNAEYLYQ